MATVRRELLIQNPAEDLWSIVCDPGRLYEWFPGVVSSIVTHSDGVDSREVVLASGFSLTEEIVTNDPLLRRFQYRISNGVFRSHLATIDVIDLAEHGRLDAGHPGEWDLAGSCLVVYSTEAVPDVMALVLGGASGEALHNLARLTESRMENP